QHAQAPVRPLLIQLHQPRIARYICDQNRSKLALDTLPDHETIPSGARTGMYQTRRHLPRPALFEMTHSLASIMVGHNRLKTVSLPLPHAPPSTSSCVMPPRTRMPGTSRAGRFHHKNGYATGG